jgi:(p)ppGpp synthase/HD superfamily hydrolase
MTHHLHNDGDMLETALALAVEKHRGQRDKAGAPYVLHPIRMMLRFTDPAAQVVALLHDVVEDCDVTLDDLRQHGFPETVVSGVLAMTRDPAESYEAFIERAAAHPIARQVKLADVEDNLDLRRLNALTDRDVKRLGRYLAARQRLMPDTAPDAADSSRDG